MRTIAFIIPPTVQLLDLAGPLQVFTEAKFHGYKLNLAFYSYQPHITCSAGLPLGVIKNYTEAQLKEGDYLFIAGMDFNYINSYEFRTERKFFNWLRSLPKSNITVCSVCNGAFALGEAGLLSNIECTTHWRRVKALQKRFPDARVIEDTLFVKQGRIYTSAGISAGIDLALSILEDLKGPLFTHKIARGLVVYHRRSHNHTQESVYLDYRNHTNPRVHIAQDYIIENIGQETDIETLASLVSMSPRNLSRVFKENTGLTILQYITQIRIETAKTLLNNPDYTMDTIAANCGFKTSRQLHRILKVKRNKVRL